MKPLKSAVVSLLANTAPVAFGAMAAPIIALNGVTGLPLHELSSMAGRQTPFIALIVPLLLVFIVDGRRGVKQTWPVALVAGVAFGAAQFVTSNYFAVELTDVVAAVVTVAAVLLMLKVWQPKEIVGVEGAVEGAPETAHAAVAVTAGSRGTGSGAGATAGSGSAAGSVAGSDAAARCRSNDHGAHRQHAARTPADLDGNRPLPDHHRGVLGRPAAVRQDLAGPGRSVTFAWPGLDITDTAGKPVAATKFKLDHLKATGTLLLFSGLLTMVLYKVTASQGLRIYRDTLVQLRWTILTVVAVLALAYVMNFSGQTVTLGFALAATGGFFAFLSPVVGWIGVAVTGSDTSANSLFGLLQTTAAEQTGLSPSCWPPPTPPPACWAR